MTHQIPPYRNGVAAILFGLAAAAVYMLMTHITLAHLEDLSGRLPFDMRPYGYGAMQAKEIIGGLGQDGRAYYLTRQIPLDMLYPALLALALVNTISWLLPDQSGNRIKWMGFAFSIGAALSDYAENLGIVAMILSWPELPQVLVSASSVASVSKSILTIAAVMFVICAGIIRVLPVVSAKG